MDDNVSNALTMAGSVLLFVIGLAVCMLSFSQARVAIDSILSYSDRESASIEEDPRYYYLSSANDTNRYVGKETIIPAIYRAYKENFKIVFKFNDDYYLYVKDITNPTSKICSIDLIQQSIGSDLASRQFLDGIIYGVYTADLPGDARFTPQQRYVNLFGIEPNIKSLYKYLNEKQGSTKIKESLGTYYIDELNATPENIQDVNKTERRVITYEFLAK